MIVALVLTVLRLSGVHEMAAAVPVCGLPENVVLEAHNLLRDLGASFPVHCLPHNANATFPRAALTNGTQCRRTLRVLHRVLEGAEQVFQDNHLPRGEGGLTWNEQKLEHFQNLQNRLVDEGGCLSAGALLDPDLLPYFDNVTALLQQQDSAICGWSMLRRDVLWTLNAALRRCFS